MSNTIQNNSSLFQQESLEPSVPVTIDTIPSELILEIFSFLGFRDLISCLIVNKQWCDLACALNENVPCGPLAQIIYVISLETSFTEFSRFQSAIVEKSTELSLGNTKFYEMNQFGLPRYLPPPKITALHLSHLIYFKNLRYLDFFNGQFVDNALSCLHSLPITSLKLYECRFTDLKGLENHPTLESLNLLKSSVRNEMLESLRFIPNLKKIILSHTSVSNLSGLVGSHVEILYLAGCRIERESLSQMGTTPHLTTLFIGSCYTLENRDLKDLKSKSLKHLSLSQWDWLTTEGLQNLKHLNLKSLIINNCTHIEDSDLEHLSDHALVSLNVSYCSKITDLGLNHIGKFHLLTELDLSGCRELSDTGMLNLSGLPIKGLKLKFCYQLTDCTLYNLTGLESLEKLNLLGCREITDKGIISLADFSLKKLNIRQCNRISQEAVDTLRKSLKNPICIKMKPKTYRSFHFRIPKIIENSKFFHLGKES